MSSLTWAELGHGVAAAKSPLVRAERERRLQAFRQLLGPGIPLDDAAAAAYETVCGLVLERGRIVRGRTVDLMIAATAVEHDAGVVTRSTDDFLGLEGFVTVLSP
ncbi:tRNA(fMet)-specific endonuclease VapC [Corynebacterium provencense]|uniref:tRNA(fMet)-specific endonuclease VapC n=1 Tax=Corynebacterium provencense TaxID=1737425 RepID=A0A2Z3YLK9_9CORY|nr:PIN domain-containing protein [Corynebacterium provencense]AWT24985.1 tRNA(fMet)-specific endonuclease VapC [Corynebacterium provencense]